MQRSKRQSLCLDYVRLHKDVQISEIAHHLNCSDSTIRRDIKALAQQGFIQEVYGSVIYVDKGSEDMLRKERNVLNVKAKEKIGQKAAQLIEDHQFIFIDAGSTTFQMLQHIRSKGCTFVTSGLDIACELMNHQLDVIILGGQIKPITEAVVGETAVDMLKTFYFDCAFIGTNGISTVGYSTPDHKEGAMKKVAIERSKRAYVLSDTSKLDVTASFVFASLDKAIWISEQ
jgi:DeoR family transcriptional regulator, fructose operon transcriptional repressor